MKTLYRRKLYLALFAAVLVAACDRDRVLSAEPAPAPAGEPKLLIIGQDLGAIRGYMASDCCPRPDALTAYVGFYDIRNRYSYGGLGMDAIGKDVGFETEWGAGPVSALRTATEFGVGSVALGLSITENDHPGALDRLVAGDFDTEISRLVTFADQIDGTLYLRIGYEFDGAWNQGYGNAERYIAAFRRIVDVMRAGGADNVEFVWQASASTTDDLIDRGHEDITRWYPGDDYVDWMAFSWFMAPDETVTVESDYEPPTPLELTEEVLDFARERGKPVMIAEASPQGLDLAEGFLAHHHPMWDGASGTGRVDMTNDALWDHWFAPMFELMETHHDVIHALAYINADWDSQPMWGPPYASGFWGDTRLEVNADIAKRFSAAVAAWKAGDPAAP